MALSRGSRTALANKGEALVFAMNAGMYAEDRTPVGLYVENGRTLQRRQYAPRRRQFPPEAQWRVLGRRRARRRHRDRALPEEPSAGAIRHAIRTDARHRRAHSSAHSWGRHVAEISQRRLRRGRPYRALRDLQPAGDVSIEFALLFRDRLHCPDALFLDGGSASALYAPSLSRHDRFAPTMGPILGVVEKANR